MIITDVVAMGHATVVLVNAHVRGHTLENSASTKVHSQLYTTILFYVFVLQMIVWMTVIVADQLKEPVLIFRQ